MRTLLKSHLKRGFSRLNDILDVKHKVNRNWVTITALCIFVSGLMYSLQSLRSSITPNFALGSTLATIALVCLTYFLNTLRTHIHSRCVKASLSFVDNARISLYSSALNMLPLVIPAGMYMRMSNMIKHGGKTGHVAGLLITNYFLILLSSILFGLYMLTQASIEIHLSIFLLFAHAYVLTLLFLTRASSMALSISICILELAAIIVDACRIWLCFVLLGFGIEPFQAAVLTLSSILGSATSIIPAGLGVRELFGSAISPFIDLLPQQAFLAIALNRLFGVAFFASLASLVFFWERRS